MTGLRRVATEYPGLIARCKGVSAHAGADYEQVDATGVKQAWWEVRNSDNAFGWLWPLVFRAMT
jgi:hypothetical protein